jgi:uncharacterized membrane protein YfcA
MTPLVPLAGLGMGLVLGVFGAGGSIVAVPVFVYLLGHDVEQAIAMSLIVVGTASLVGAVRAWRAGRVRLRPALQFGAVAILGAYGGARAAAVVSDAVQMTTFAVTVLCAAVLMLRGEAPSARAGASGASSSPHSQSTVVLALTALGVGVITGLVGVGGGFLVVPALVILAGLSMGTAVGTSLVVIVMNAAAALVGNIGRVDPPWPVLTWITAFAVIGVVVGSRLGRSIPQPALRRAFAAFLLVVGGLVLYQNRMGAAPDAAEPRAVAPAEHG